MSWKIFKLYVLILVVGAGCLAISMTNVAAGIDDTYTVEGQKIWISILGNVLVVYSLLSQIVTIPLFTTTSLTKEKASSTVVSLLGTTLTPIEIWIGKSLAVFLPGYITSIVSTLIMAPWFYRITSVSIWLFISVIVILPLFMFGVTLITVQISMFKSAEMAVAPSYIIGLLLIFGIPLATEMEFIHIETQKFAVLCMILVILLWTFEILLSRKMTKENVVLSQSR